MNAANLILLVIFLLGLWADSPVIAGAAGILLVLQVTNLHLLYPILQEHGLEVGLVFLVLSVLVPFATGRVPPLEILRSFFSLPGLVAIVSGLVATTLNSRGLRLLQEEPAMMIGLVVGSIVGVIFFGGIPVGPLMAGGVAAILLGLLGLWR